MAKRVKYTEHPSIVVLAGQPRLKVFEDFFVEEQLPKWQKVAERVKIEDEANKGTTSRVPLDPMMPPEDGPETGGNTGTTEALGKMTDRAALKDARWGRGRYFRTSAIGQTKKNSLFRRIYEALPWVDRAVPVEQAFEEVKDKMVHPTTAELIKARAIADTLIKDLKATGQYNLADSIQHERDVIVSQMILAESPYGTYLTEEQLIDFMLKTERGVKVEFLRCYRQILPEEVQKKKIEADKLLIFDNYVIVHYDKDIDKFQRIEEEVVEREREKRRDPILFGVIRGSRKLFKICDWITSDDDLTMEVVEKALGISAPTINIKDLPVPAEVDLARLSARLRVDIDKAIAESTAKGTVVNDTDLVDLFREGGVPVKQPEDNTPPPEK